MGTYVSINSNSLCLLQAVILHNNLGEINFFLMIIKKEGFPYNYMDIRLQ